MSKRKKKNALPPLKNNRLSMLSIISPEDEGDDLDTDLQAALLESRQLAASQHNNPNGSDPSPTALADQSSSHARMLGRFKAQPALVPTPSNEAAPAPRDIFGPLPTTSAFSIPGSLKAAPTTHMFGESVPAKQVRFDLSVNTPPSPTKTSNSTNLVSRGLQGLNNSTSSPSTTSFASAIAAQAERAIGELEAKLADRETQLEAAKKRNQDLKAESNAMGTRLQIAEKSNKELQAALGRHQVRLNVAEMANKTLQAELDKRKINYRWARSSSRT